MFTHKNIYNTVIYLTYKVQLHKIQFIIHIVYVLPQLTCDCIIIIIMIYCDS